MYRSTAIILIDSIADRRQGKTCDAYKSISSNRIAYTAISDNPTKTVNYLISIENVDINSSDHCSRIVMKLHKVFATSLGTLSTSRSSSAPHSIFGRDTFGGETRDPVLSTHPHRFPVPRTYRWAALKSTSYPLEFLLSFLYFNHHSNLVFLLCIAK